MAVAIPASVVMSPDGSLESPHFSQFSVKYCGAAPPGQPSTDMCKAMCKATEMIVLCDNNVLSGTDIHTHRLPRTSSAACCRPLMCWPC